METSIVAIIISIFSIIVNIVQFIVLRRATENAVKQIDDMQNTNNYLVDIINELSKPLEAIKNSTILSEDPLIKDLYSKVKLAVNKINEYKENDR